MFNIGPMELLVLAVVGLIVLGPDKLPSLARDAARMIRTLRDLSTGARAQLRDELGPEFADLDLSSLNPRTAIQRAVLGDGLDLRSLDPRADVARMVRGDDAQPAGQDGSGVSMTKPASRPLGPGEQAPYDADAT